VRNNFSQFIFNRYKKNEAYLHELNYLFWECTLRCNLRCLHCGSDCGKDNTAKDMPFEDFLKAILPLKKAYRSNSITVAITGGEPLLRKDLAQCGRGLRENGFRWGMVTNGYSYTPDIHEKLLAAGMGSITVSLDGLEPSHNWLRADDQSYKKAADAIALIVSSNRLVYDVVTCVNQKNIDELPALKELLISMEVKAWRLFTISPIGRAAHNDDLRLNPRQIKSLMEFIVLTLSDKRIRTTFSCEAYLGDYERRVRDTRFFCRAGIQVASILADGSISACPNINRCFVQGNIYNDEFLDVWNKRFEIMRDRGWTKTGICEKCDVYKNCNGGAMHLWNEKKDTIMTCIYQQLLYNGQ
jgi:radical SAM enzyme (rSAM/lipoprotein system)